MASANSDRDESQIWLQAAAAPILLLDASGAAVRGCSDAALRLLGRKADELVGRTVAALFVAAADCGDRSATATPAGDERVVHVRPDGTQCRLLRVQTPLPPGSGDGSLLTLVDVTEQDRQTAELRDERQFLSRVIQALPAAVFVKDQHDGGRYVLCSGTTEDMSNLPHDHVLGRRDAELFSPACAQAFRDADARVMATGHMEVTEATICRQDGSVVVTETKKMVLPHDGEGPRYVLGTTEDITKRREIELRLARVAMLDPLTGLANRMLFREKLRAALKLRHQAGGIVVLHCLDLDQFKGVNDTLGHAAGDLLLTQVGARLEAICGSAHPVARLGGDEFAIIQGPVGTPQEATDLAARVAQSLSAPFEIDGKILVIGSSAGLAMAPLHGDDPDTLARSADIALYGAKEHERGAYRFFEPEMASRIQARHRLEEDLREALAHGDFELFYQPIIDIGSHRLAGFEALLRWKHATRGYVPPSVIIPVAEESGLIVKLGDWVLREACREAATWPGQFGISVNLSSVQFRNPGLAASVASALLASGLSASRLELEITESVLLTNNEANLSTLHQLRDLGIRISLDDFGTGYSSLGYLSAFPFHKIKIDRSFVQDLGSTSNCLAIVRSVIKLADDLGMTTTAEGVETSQQLDHLRLEGCTQAQGYLFDRPQPATALAAIIAGFGTVSAAA